MARITEDARNCSVFLGWEAPKKGDPAAIREAGTGFFVEVGGVAYLVTAAHVARQLDGGPFAIRLVDDNHAARLDPVDRPKWHYHSDKTIDVAVMLYDPPDWAGNTTTMMPSSEILRAANVQAWDIGPGDACYLVGLFYLHAGTHRNQPVVHTGNIALMPSDDLIPVRRQHGSGSDLVRAYLVEMHALKGASGSPVMVRPTIRFMARELSDKQESVAIAEARDYLLGVWVASWPGRTSKELKKAMGFAPDDEVPIGMGIVVPAERILEIVARAEVKAERDAAIAEVRGANAAQPSSAPSRKAAPTSDENPKHKEAFNRLLKRASKPKS